MSYQSSTSDLFQSTVKSWIASNGECLVLIRHHAAAGNKDFEFFNSYAAFHKRVEALPPRTCFVVFRDRQLPIRGTADEELISSALDLIPDGNEWLIVTLHPRTEGKMSWFHHVAGETHMELRLEIAGCNGESVAVGLYPPWLEDSDVVISAVVPEHDGTVTTGVY